MGRYTYIFSMAMVFATAFTFPPVFCQDTIFPPAYPARGWSLDHPVLLGWDSFFAGFCFPWGFSPLLLPPTLRSHLFGCLASGFERPILWRYGVRHRMPRPASDGLSYAAFFATLPAWKEHSEGGGYTNPPSSAPPIFSRALR